MTDEGIKVSAGSMTLGLIIHWNRPVGVTSITLSVDQTPSAEDCDKTSNEYSKLDIQPLVVEAGKIDVRAAKFVKPSFLVPVLDLNKNKQFSATACLGVEFITPAHETLYGKVSVGTHYRLEPLVSIVELQASEPQHVLYQRWGTIFGHRE